LNRSMHMPSWAPACTTLHQGPACRVCEMKSWAGRRQEGKTAGCADMQQLSCPAQQLTAANSPRETALHPLSTQRARVHYIHTNMHIPIQVASMVHCPLPTTYYAMRHSPPTCKTAHPSVRRPPWPPRPRDEAAPRLQRHHTLRLRSRAKAPV
jgi:hypothetical protein